jgi:hypothetical protein
LNEHDFLITPHLDTDCPDDGLLPDDKIILLSGVFNLGFLGIRNSSNSLAFLKWWQQKLKTKCIIDHAGGYFVDQRFIDLAITLFPGFYIERDTGFNTAYWNLHSRRLSFDGGSWKCNGGPLYFFHFSAYKLEKPELVSRHTNRFTVASRPDAKPIFDEYRRQLIENGYFKTYQWPYTFGAFQDGDKISYEMRRNYRIALTVGLKEAEPFQSRKSLEEKLAAAGVIQLQPRAVMLLKKIVRNLTPPALWNGMKWIKYRSAR